MENEVRLFRDDMVEDPEKGSADQKISEAGTDPEDIEFIEDI